MPTLGRETCFNTGVGDDDEADDVMLIFILVNPVVDRNFLFKKKNMLTRTCVCFRFYTIKSRDVTVIHELIFLEMMCDTLYKASFRNFGVAGYRDRNYHL
jgi:hypothetical protein